MHKPSMAPDGVKSKTFLTKDYQYDNLQEIWAYVNSK